MSRSVVTYAALVLIVVGAVGYYVLRAASADHDEQPASVTSSPSTRGRGDPLDQTPSTDPAAHNPASVKPLKTTEDPITSKFLVARQCYYARMGVKQFQEVADCQDLASKQETARAYGECLKTWDEAQATITRFQRQIANLHCPEDADGVGITTIQPNRPHTRVIRARSCAICNRISRYPTGAATTLIRTSQTTKHLQLFISKTLCNVETGESFNCYPTTTTAESLD